MVSNRIDNTLFLHIYCEVIIPFFTLAIFTAIFTFFFRYLENKLTISVILSWVQKSVRNVKNADLGNIGFKNRLFAGYLPVLEILRLEYLFSKYNREINFDVKVPE